MKKIWGSLVVLISFWGLLTVPVLAADGQTRVEIGFYGGQTINQAIPDRQIPNGKTPYIISNSRPASSSKLGYLPQTDETTNWLFILLGISVFMIVLIMNFEIKRKLQVRNNDR